MYKFIILGIGFAIAITLASCEKESFDANPASNVITEPAAPVADNPSTRDEDPVPMRGHLKGTAGVAISGADVSLTRSGESSSAYNTSTDSEGAYIFSSVNQGNYSLKFTASGYITKTIPLAVFDTIIRTDTLIAE